MDARRERQACDDLALERAHLEALRDVSQSDDRELARTAEWMMFELEAAVDGFDADRVDVSRYVGTYGDYTLSARNGELYVKRNHIAARRIVPVAEHWFGLEMMEHYARYGFELDRQGRVAALLVSSPMREPRRVPKD